VERLTHRVAARVARISAGLAVAADDQDAAAAEVVADAREVLEEARIGQALGARLPVRHELGEPLACLGAGAAALIEQAHPHGAARAADALRLDDAALLGRAPLLAGLAAHALVAGEEELLPGTDDG